MGFSYQPRLGAGDGPVSRVAAAIQVHGTKKGVSDLRLPLVHAGRVVHCIFLDHCRRIQPLRGRLDGRGETAALAGRLIEESCSRQQIAKGQLTIHADCGTSMTSKPVALLLSDLGVTKSHSRPHVSNDNPYPEAQFKTLKYRPVFPERFGSLEDAPRPAHPARRASRSRRCPRHPTSPHSRKRMARSPRALPARKAGTAAAPHRGVINRPKQLAAPALQPSPNNGTPATLDSC